MPSSLRCQDFTLEPRTFCQTAKRQALRPTVRVWHSVLCGTAPCLPPRCSSPTPTPDPFHFLPWHAIGHASASLLSPQHGEFLRARGSVPSPQYLTLEKWLALFTASVCRTEERLVLIRIKLAVDTQMPPGRCSSDYFTRISLCHSRGALDGALIFLLLMDGETETQATGYLTNVTQLTNSKESFEPYLIGPFKFTAGENVFSRVSQEKGSLATPHPPFLSEWRPSELSKCALHTGSPKQILWEDKMR